MIKITIKVSEREMRYLNLQKEIFGEDIQGKVSEMLDIEMDGNSSEDWFREGMK